MLKEQNNSTQKIPSGKYLGVLCKREHDWEGTGKSLKYKSGGICVSCVKIYNQTTQSQQRRRIYKQSSKGKISAKNYRQSVKGKIAMRRGQNRFSRTEKCRIYNNEWRKHQYKTNPQYRLNRIISIAMRKSLKRGTKNNQHWEELVPYENCQLEIYLKSTIPKGYTWQDFLDGKLHIDHIIPVSAFNFSSPDHIDFKRCWALSNLRLLSAGENLVKSNRLSEAFQPSLMI